MIFLQLLWTFFRVGLFSIGGGYAILPTIQNYIVSVQHWLSMEQFMDVIAISEMTPGPIAINAATFTGIQIAGIGGALVATLGCVLPSFAIVLALAFIYNRYRQLPVIQSVLKSLRPAVVAMIASAGLSIVLTAFWGGQPLSLPGLNPVAAGLFAAGLFALRRWKPNPALIILGSGIVGGAVYMLL